MSDSEDRDAVDRGHQARMCLESFEKFFKFYWPLLVRYLKSQASNSAWAEDVAEETMIAVLDRWSALLVMERPDSYLFTIATRKLRRLEAQARENCCLGEDLASAGADLRLAAAADKWVEDHHDLIAGMRSLPRRQCEVIGLHYFGGYTLAETAQILDVQEGTVKKHLNRGLENLRRRQGIATAPKLIRRIPV